MGRLIDTDAAYSVLTDYYHHSTDTQHAALREALGRVESVDAVEVVRCKDCKMFYMKKDIFGKVPWCKAWHRGTIETMFCGWGKRKDGEQHGADIR